MYEEVGKKGLSVSANTHTSCSVGAAGAVVESAGALVEGLVVAMVPVSATNTT